MKKLVQKVKWALPGSPVQEMYIYGEESRNARTFGDVISV